MELAAFIIALTLACVAGFEFFYLMYLETINRQQQRRIRQLERKLGEVARELESAEALLEELQEEEEELWPEVIDDDSVR
jgi:flagellar biosynthesis chaperone FliJ